MSEPLVYQDTWVKRILAECKRVAMVGASSNEMRPSYFVMLYLQKKGFRVLPVNPGAAGKEILGEPVYASLDELPIKPDMVDIFRRSEDVAPIVEDAMRLAIPTIWMQLGVRDDAVAARAEAAGHRVVMDRCPKIEYGRLFGEIGWLGVNRRIISAKRSTARQLGG